MEYTLAEQSKAGPARHRPFDELQLGHMTFYHAVIDPPGEPSPHRLFVFLDSRSKGLELRDFALVRLRQPSVEAHPSTLA